jgi:asparagine N-glycosylation enzyme membrane subunit Stt3
VSTSKPAPVTGVILLALAVLLAVGLNTFAGPCQSHGSETNACFWAYRAVLGMDAVLGVLSVVRVFELDEGERRGLSLAAALMGVLIAATPGLLIGLCDGTGMHCQEVMKPFCMAVGVAVALVGGIDLTRRLLALRK